MIREILCLLWLSGYELNSNFVLGSRNRIASVLSVIYISHACVLMYTELIVSL